MIFLDRGKKAAGPFLQWRLGLFSVGAAVGLVGMARDSRILVGVAIGILAVGVGLRFAGPGPDDGGEAVDEHGEGHDEDDRGEDDEGEDIA